MTEVLEMKINRKMKKITLLFTIMLLALLSYASADFCTLRGRIFYNDSAPVKDNTTLYIHYPYYNFTYQTWTGREWPWKNYYFYTFSCRQNSDSVIMYVENHTQELDLDSGVIDYDLILPFEENEKQEYLDKNPTDDRYNDIPAKKEESKSKGSAKIPKERISAQEGSSFEIVLSHDWIDLSKISFIILNMSENQAEVLMIPNQQKMIFSIGESKNLDIDDDEEFEIIMTLEQIDAKKAFFKIDRYYYPQEHYIPKDSSPEIQEPSAIADELTREDMIATVRISYSILASIAAGLILITTLSWLSSKKKDKGSEKNITYSSEEDKS